MDLLRTEINWKAYSLNHCEDQIIIKDHLGQRSPDKRRKEVQLLKLERGAEMISTKSPDKPDINKTETRSKKTEGQIYEKQRSDRIAFK